jgi:hypothetical protein
MRCPEKAETSVRIGPFPPCSRGPDVAGYLEPFDAGVIVQFESAVLRKEHVTASRGATRPRSTSRYGPEASSYRVSGSSPVMQIACSSIG